MVGQTHVPEAAELGAYFHISPSAAKTPVPRSGKKVLLVSAPDDKFQSAQPYADAYLRTIPFSNSSNWVARTAWGGFLNHSSPIIND